MSTAQSGGIPSSNSLASERVKLRAQGYSEAEVSQILIAREVGGSSGAGAAGQGVMSTVLSSIVAVASHARALVPSFKQDFIIIFSPSTSFGARLGSTFTLALKIAVVAVLAYAGLQEWNRHIISETAIADIEVRKRFAEECLARIKMADNLYSGQRQKQIQAVVMDDCDPILHPNDPKHSHTR